MKISLKGGEKLQKEVKLESSSEIKDFSEYAENKLAIAKICVLSTANNSHHLEISEKVLRRDIGSIRGNFLVADMVMGDASTHTPSEVPVGYFLPNEEIEFEEVETDEGKVVKAWAYAVLSKQYAKSAYEMFVNDNHRATSIEMTVLLDEEDENKVISFDAFGSTILGKTVAPSCKDAEISLVRFAEEAESFFKESNNLTALEKFAEERKQSMAEKKSYKVDKSKEAMSTKEWGSVDKTSLRNKIMEASNRDKLVKDVYMLVEDGWQDAPSEKLKYPVMCFEGGKLVYNEGGLSSALGYAKKENESSVITKVEKIRKKLGLDDNTEGKEETAKMSKEIEFAAVNIGDMWGKVFDALHAKYPDGDWGSVYCIEGIYEENNKKFAIIRQKDEETKYRLDFSLTEDGLELSDEIIKVELEIVETDEVRKFAEPENVEKYRKFADDDDDDEIEGRKAWAKVIKKVQDHEGEGTYVDSIEDDHIIYTKDDVRYRVNAKVETNADDKTVDAEIDWDSVKKDKIQKMSADEMEAEMARLKKDIEDRDNIIMKKDTELAELRAFKKGVEDKEKAMSIEAVMEEIKGFIDEAKFKEFREEGLACEMSEVDAWKNKVKAFCFEAGVKNPKKNKREEIFSFAMDVNKDIKKNDTVWDRLRNL